MRLECVRRSCLPLAGIILAAGVAGCGIPLQEGAKPLPVGAMSTPSPVATIPNGRSQLIFLVSGRQLEPIKEMIFVRSANGIMAALAAGPGPDRPDLRTLLLDPLTGIPMLEVSHISPAGQVSLQSSEAFAQMPAMDQILLLGQVALSMTELGLSSITVLDAGGATFALPLPDGRVRTGPASSDDYRSLVRMS